MIRAVLGTGMLVVGFVGLHAGFAPLGGCGSSVRACTASEYGFQQSLTARQLLYAEGRPCEEPITVVSSDAEFERTWKALGAEAVDRPRVDFASQRVIISNRAAELGRSWTATDGASIAIGLQRCATSELGEACATEVLVVDSVVESARTTTCDPVGCGNPVAPTPTVPRP